MGLEVLLTLQVQLQTTANTLQLNFPDLDWWLLVAHALKESKGIADAVGDSNTDYPVYGLWQMQMRTVYQYRDLRDFEIEDMSSPVRAWQAYSYHLIRVGNWLSDYYAISDYRWLFVVWNWGSGNVKTHLDAGCGYEDLPESVILYVEDIERIEFELRKNQ